MHVVVGIDGSDQGYAALAHAARFARAVDGRIVLVRVLSPVADCADVWGETLAEAVDRLAATWMNELSALTETLAVRSTIARVVVKRRFESTAEAIVRVSTEYDTRLLVLGTRGTGFARRALIGSVAAQVLKGAYWPVMLVGMHVEAGGEAPPYRVIITSDGCAPSDGLLTAFPRAVAGASPGSICVTAVHVYESGATPRPDEVTTARQGLSTFAARLPQQFDPKAELLVDDQRLGPTDTIVKYAQQTGANCIWMATQKASWPRQALLGSVALNTVDRASVPVVLIRAKEAE